MVEGAERPTGHRDVLHAAEKAKYPLDPELSDRRALPRDQSRHAGNGANWMTRVLRHAQNGACKGFARTELSRR